MSGKVRPTAAVLLVIVRFRVA